jgi:hypothetical protein
VFQDTLLHAVERLRIQGGKDEDRGILQQRASDVEPTALPMGELPAGLADDLPQPSRHALEQRPESQGVTQSLRLLQVGRTGWPVAPHEQVKG